ncbi:MAG: GNAT family N-acetyltransferase [Deltaproteobacteria bacterium]|nr:GNAT family N-acetyltransferase [Deltaproteobacteria bacterium]
MEVFTPEDNIPALLGPRYVRATYRWFVISKRAYTLIAVARGNVVGLVAVTDTSFTTPLFRASFLELLRSLAKKPLILFQKRLWQRLARGDKSSTRLRKRIVNDRRVAQLAVIIVKKEFRGQGIFPALIDAAKAISKGRGSRAIRAGVYKENRQSRRAFEKVGWIEMPELEANNLVFYVTYLDSEFAEEMRASAGQFS